METVLDERRETILKQARHTLGTLRDTLADAASTEQDRLALAESIRQLDELFLLVVAGEFNAGKSAFINALLGQTLLKEGATPTTAQIHQLQYGADVSHTPLNNGMLLVTAPVDLLRNINMVDTPGTNAIERDHEAITTEFIPRSDLVLFLTSADRPFTESERTFLTQIKAWGKKIVLIINKIDILAEESDRTQVIDFVTKAGHDLVGDIAAVFPVSAKQAQQAKAGQPQLWETSGFGPLEQFVEQTLDDTGRYKLKLLNPLGVGQKLTAAQLQDIDRSLASLTTDKQLLTDIREQTTIYNDDMQRNFRARLSEIDTVLYEMEKRGYEFFDDTIRLGRVMDLVRTERIRAEYEAKVVGDTPKKIEARVSELIDWMVEQDLRQWTAVSDHLARRRQDNDNRIVGQTGPREGTLAYDRQRLIDSLGRATDQAISSYDERAEAIRLANGAREAVAGTALAGIGGIGVGAIVAAFGTAMWDFTGIAAGITGIALGLFILPARRRRAKKELEEKVSELRQQLVANLTEQFEREMRRGSQRVEDTVAPFDRFVRAEDAKLTDHRTTLEQLADEMSSLRAAIDAL